MQQNTTWLLTQIEESIAVHEAMKQCVPLLLEIAEKIVASLQKGGTVFLCGNGGSAADAQHWAAELSGRFKQDRAPLAAIALGMNASELTAIANDYAYAEIFSRPLEALGKSGDVLIGISTSGNSLNVLKAFEVARNRKMLTIAFTGKGGGEMVQAANFWLEMPSSDTARIQEGHELCGHLLCAIIEREMFC